MPIHSQRLERWLGADQVERLSWMMGGGGPYAAPRWFGPPIAVARVPGRVFATRDGDFVGRLREGRFSTLVDYSIQQSLRGWRRTLRRLRLDVDVNEAIMLGEPVRLHAGFTSLSDLISEATAGGKARQFMWQKAGATGVIAVTNSLWGVGAMPAAGADGSAAPGGRALTDATTGCYPFTNPTGGDTLHFTTGFPNASVAGNTLLLYDRIFDVAKTMNSTVAESVTGVPTRYQSSVATDPDYAGGNFLFVEVGGTALAATAHNWTTCTYRNQAGTDAQTLPVLTGNASAIARRLDHPVGQWFAPLATGDVGVMDLAQMQCSAAVATGVINFVIGHPIAWLPCAIANMTGIVDGINSAFGLTRIFDDAALALLEVTKPATTATNYNVQVTAVAG